MLVITRRKHETVHIGDNVAVTIVHTNGNKVRLGIVAPDGVKILRDNAVKTQPHKNTRDARRPRG